jgi:protein-tyrosine phosphatase
MLLKNNRLIALVFIGLPLVAATPSVPGIENFYKVDQNVYRGAQPTNEGFKYLSNLGVKVVIDLREHDQRSLAEEKVVTAAGMRYLNVPMTGLTPPTEAETSTILNLLEDAAAGPIFVHCKRGADRTGAVIAAYRIDHDKWQNAQALEEAMHNRMSIFQAPRQGFIRTFHGRVATTPVDASASAPAVADATKAAAANNN